jgi:TPR repeat protein
MLRRLALAGMVVLLLGGAPLAQIAEPAQGDRFEALRTRANAGHASAQTLLGSMYYNGEGVPQDDGEAYRWANLAATYADASDRDRYAEFRDRTGERLTPEQRADAQRRAPA